jgi:serine/threonine-protein kinase
MAGESATAQVLFDSAVKLMAQGRWAEACPKLEESQQLDPAGGTVLHLAICRDHEGKMATAWALYHDALTAAQHDNRKDRAKVAQGRIDALTPTLPRMRVRVAEADTRLPEFQVSRDGRAMGPSQWGEAFPVDPGSHTLTATARGYTTWTDRVTASPGVEVVVRVPDLQRDAPPEPSVRPEQPADRTASPPEPSEAASDSPSARRVVGAALGIAGGAAFAATAVLGLMSLSKHDEADRGCAPPTYLTCSPAGAAAGDKAITYGNVSTVAFVVGSVLAAAGAILFFTAPTPTRRKAYSSTHMIASSFHAPSPVTTPFSFAIGAWGPVSTRSSNDEAIRTSPTRR